MTKILLLSRFLLVWTFWRGFSFKLTKFRVTHLCFRRRLPASWDLIDRAFALTFFETSDWLFISGSEICLFTNLWLIFIGFLLLPKFYLLKLSLSLGCHLLLVFLLFLLFLVLANFNVRSIWISLGLFIVMIESFKILGEVLFGFLLCLLKLYLLFLYFTGWQLLICLFCLLFWFLTEMIIVICDGDIWFGWSFRADSWHL